MASSTSKQGSEGAGSALVRRFLAGRRSAGDSGMKVRTTKLKQERFGENGPKEGRRKDGMEEHLQVRASWQNHPMHHEIAKIALVWPQPCGRLGRVRPGARADFMPP